MKFSLPLLPLAAVLAFSHVKTSQAALLAYDSFSYAAGSLIGANGGSGFSGAYTGGSSAVSNPGYNYTDSNLIPLTTAGNKADLLDNNNGAFRTLTSSPDAVGSTLYISFIAQFSNTNGYAGLSLFEGAGSETMYLGKASNQTTFGIDPKSGTVVNSTTLVTTNSFLVYKISFLAASATISLYVNPTLGTEPGSPTITATRTAAFTFDRLRIQAGNGSSGSIDEIRLGTTYADVAPVPEPSALILSGSLVGLLALRRRR